MSVRRRALVAVILALASVPLTSSASAAPPVDPGALAHCASMTAADERLACYDSLSHPKPNPAPAASAATAAPPAAANPAGPAAAAAAGSAAAAGASSAPEGKSFGLTRHTPPAEEGPDRIQAKITRVDTDRIGNVRVALDNGQSWVFYSPEAVLRTGEGVTIKRGALGSFLLTSASHHTYKVQRAQ